MAKAKSNGSRGGRTKGSRKSKAESMTGAKAAKVEVRGGATIGDNSGEFALPKPDDWDFHFRTIKGLAEKSQTAASLLRHAKTSAKKAGIDMEAMNRTLSEDKAPDPAKMARYLEQLNLGLKQSGSPIAITVHDTILGDVNEAAYKRGFADGEGGKSANNRYPENSDLSKQYTRGWQHGTGKNLGQTPEQVDAAMADEEFEAAAPARTAETEHSEMALAN